MNDQPVLVLVAEDDPLASMALQAQVEALGFAVAGVARDGREAEAMTRCLPVQLGIFDMKMPGRTGLEVATAIFPDAPTPVLLLTGFGAADLPDPVPEPPIFGLLTKPIGLAELGQGIERTLARFRDWAADHDRARSVHDSLDERRVIQRAIARADEPRPVPAATTRFLARARDENTSPAEMARRILRSDAGA